MQFTESPMAKAIFKTNEAGGYILGSAKPCPHCGDMGRVLDLQTPKGLTYSAYYPSDTCCKRRANEVLFSNRHWAQRTTEEFELGELHASTADINRIMQPKKLAL